MTVARSSVSDRVVGEVARRSPFSPERKCAVVDACKLVASHQLEAEPAPVDVVLAQGTTTGALGSRLRTAANTRRVLS